MQPESTNNSMMYQNLSRLALAVMITYVVYNGLITVFIVPFVAGDSLREYAYPVLPVFLATVCIVLSYTGRHRAASVIATVLTVGIFFFWWFIVCGGKKPIWSDFKGIVVPEIIFATATLSRWALDQNHKLTPSVSVYQGE
jgi:cytochrome bd-type quinol oxidase subunit 2